MFVEQHRGVAASRATPAWDQFLNHEWRDTMREWGFRFERWMRDPSRMGSAFSGIAFDYRPVAGPLEVQSVLTHHPKNCAGEQEFMPAPGSSGGPASRPPTGFTKDAVLESKGKSAFTLHGKQRHHQISRTSRASAR